MTAATALGLTTYQVSLAGKNDWQTFEAFDHAAAGEEFVAAWCPPPDDVTYELDVKGPDGELYAVTVEVDVSVTLSSFAFKRSGHPAASCEVHGDDLLGGDLLDEVRP